MENYKSIDKHPTQSTITQMYKEALNLIIENQLQNENECGTKWICSQNRKFSRLFFFFILNYMFPLLFICKTGKTPKV